MLETLGQIRDAGWKVKARCAFGGREGLKSVRRCVYSAELELNTLVWTRGRDFPLGMLASRLRCPRCGSREVSVMFVGPAQEGKQGWR